MCPDLEIAKKILPIYDKIGNLNRKFFELQGDFWVKFEDIKSHEFREKLADVLYQIGNFCDEILAEF